MARGCFITFEGIDGSGKGTQIRLLTEWLVREHGQEPLQVREPGGTELGEKVRDLVLHGDDMAPAAEALLYATARAEMIHSKVRPALEAGRVVIADRFVHSSIAYQGAGRELGEDRVRNANELATAGLTPDLVILLRLSVADAEARLAADHAGDGAGPDRLERAGRDFFERVAASYDRLAAQEHQIFAVLDATLSVEDIQLAIRSVVTDALQASGVA